MVTCKTIGLSKSFFSDKEEINAIINCNLELKAGECIAVCGSRASGKSTLLRMLSGFERPSGGTVLINQKDITAYSDDELAMLRRNEIGYVLQNDSLIAELNVHENIVMPAIIAHKRYNKDYYEDLISHFQLKELLAFKPKQLNDSQCQAVIYARALINNPNIILIDENNNGPRLDKKILDYLLNLVYMKGKTLIMVCNDNEFDIFTDHIIRLDRGEVVENRRIS